MGELSSLFKMIKKKLTFIFLLFLISFASADVISINSGGSDNIIINPDQYIEGFFSQIPGEVDEAPQGAGGGISPLLKELNETVCFKTYDYLLDYGTDYTKISILQKDLEEINISVNYVKLRDEYINSFQGGCSELINRTLKPEFVCQSILDFAKLNNNTISYEDMTSLKNEIDSVVKVTFGLLEYYILNYDDLCIEFTNEPLVIKVIKKKSLLWLWCILCFLILLTMFDYFLNKKRIYTYLKVRFKKNKNLLIWRREDE